MAMAKRVAETTTDISLLPFWSKWLAHLHKPGLCASPLWLGCWKSGCAEQEQRPELAEKHGQNHGSDVCYLPKRTVAAIAGFRRLVSSL